MKNDKGEMIDTWCKKRLDVFMEGNTWDIKIKALDKLQKVSMLG